MITVSGSGDAPERIKRLVARADDMGPALRDLGGHWQRRVKESMPALPPGKAAAKGKPPAVHTSDYVHSIVYEADADGVELGSTSIRARLLHFGGVVKAKRRKYLTIPIAKQSYGKSMRQFPDIQMLAVFRRDGMLKMLWGLKAVSYQETPLFVLQPQVTIQPHPHIEITGDDWEYFERAVTRQLGSA